MCRFLNFFKWHYIDRNEIPSHTCQMALEKTINNKCWRECREKGTSSQCCRECTLVQPLWKNKKTERKFPQDIKNKTTVGSSNLISRYFFKKIKW